MKIIISHDVDHLYNKDHWFRDLIIEKLLVRSFIHVLQGRITIRVFWQRILFVFQKRWNRIKEIIETDKKYGIPSTFFFGMNQGLGMSYKPEEARKEIIYVREQGFSVGVHGIEYDNIENMRREYQRFCEISGDFPCGIRNHYVRYHETTFSKMSEIGYIFDSTEFNKEELELKNPYKINGMWEFPLHIMDSYIMPQGDIEKGKKNTLEALENAEQMGLTYFTILFHDYLYNDRVYPNEKNIMTGW